MFKEGLLDKILRNIKKLIPKSVFDFFAPVYHATLAYVGAFLYGFPSRSMKVIGVTGTKGKSTTVFLISKILEAAELTTSEGQRTSDVNVEERPPQGGVAAIGSLGYKIKDKEWPNTLKMTMPGRFKLQKFLAEAKRAGCKYVVLEVTSEGIKQKRHMGVKFDCAVFTNLHEEHIESHGSFKNYYKAKQELFKKTSNIHVINADDPRVDLFGNFPAKHKIFYGLEKGDLVAGKIQSTEKGTSFELYGTRFDTHLAGEFNVMNCLAALAVGAMYKIDLPAMKPVLESIKFIPGRMEFIQREPFGVVVDYAHTPDSLRSVYQTLRKNLAQPTTNPAPSLSADRHSERGRAWSGAGNRQPTTGKLICVLGAAGGGRDKWKRPEFGRIASEYCDEIILTNEDPYDENPQSIIKDIERGFSSKFSIFNFQFSNKSQLPNHKIILDRREAIQTALTDAGEGDTVIITGKGSETSMAVAGGRKLPWSDKDVVREALRQQSSCA
ncbi:MAG: UDP-N-acetylmuramoyl-L-alanyl-D-glutamate--2,6-diaminopimelate ligase [Candidatus Yanofskybacteria bacterium]|nr:UDP-N-acetylmuramoyl-L-alanyl-D-glutamate--2,6-diaminopimelate ligase [Candidatus Yanofskybacteria bacterium]